MESRLALSRHQLGIGGAKLPEQLRDRRIGKPAAIPDIFHVAVIACIEFVKQRVVLAVEYQFPDAEPLAQFGIECRRHLEHPPLQPQRDIAVIDEQIGSHQIRKLGRIQVVFHIGKTDGRGNAGGA